MKYICNLLIISVFLYSCKQTPKATPTETPIKTQSDFDIRITSLSQSNTTRDSLLLANYKHALQNFNKDPTATHTIWLGRRIAYTGAYKEAINVFTKGIAQFPNDARLYRHRGHRYITTRQFNKAIIDFEDAADLIKGKVDRIEPDGMPNRLNTPVSSLHTNIWYHLGLTYYVQNNLEKALEAFKNCLEASKNDDMIVATTHWLYMIQRRLNHTEAAKRLLAPITNDMTIIENDGYHQLLLFYKGQLTEDSLKGNGASGSSEAVKYGVANWHHYNGDVSKAEQLYKDLVSTGNKAGFGFIAAEADLERL
ncbi:hypothetical protein FBALC1_11467 [Flavobacteriales bacterium ALC-1]|nr:hypothetical protein FBALC1_11467 [Flavobacteriales bacterium ALC-1]